MVDRLAPITNLVDRYATALRLEGSSAATFEAVVGPILKDEVATAARAAFGADLRPFKDKAVTAGFGYDREKIPNGLRMIVKLRPVGIWAFGEHGAGPHRIGAPKGQGGRYGRIWRPPFRHPVRGIDHPGSTGKKAIRYAFKRVRNAQRAAVVAGIHAVLEEVR